MSVDVHTPRPAAIPDTRLPQVRLLLVVLAVAPLTVGVLASFAPRAFFDDFPFFAAWVANLPPYNEHLVTDVGGLQLAFGLLFAYAAWRPSRELVVPLCAGWAVSQVLHNLFHLRHLEPFTTADAIGQTVALLAVLALPLLIIRLVRRA